jgi:hypothetical protein
MFRTTTTAALAAMLTFASAGSAWATTEIYAKQGGTVAEEGKLFDDCVAKAKTAEAEAPNHYTNPYAYGATSPAAIIAVSLVSGFMQGVHESRERQRFEDRCMRKAGWAKVALTFPEEAAYSKAPEAERPAWTDAFLQGDIAGRVQVALTPKAAKMPTPGAEPAFGAVRFDPASLTVAAAPAGKGEALLTGKVSHRRTATLQEDVKVPLPIGSIHVPKGAVFQQIDLRTPADAADEEASALWCGHVKPALAIGRAIPECFWTDFEGYHFGSVPAGFLDDPPGFKSWLVTGPSFESGNTRVFEGPVPLEVSDTDLLGELDFRLRLDKIEKDGLRLSAVAARDGKDVVFWSARIATDQSGKAILPFWTHRLSLTVQGDKVTAAYTADGDGAGLAEVGKPAPRTS